MSAPRGEKAGIFVPRALVRPKPPERLEVPALRRRAARTLVEWTALRPRPSHNIYVSPGRCTFHHPPRTSLGNPLGTVFFGGCLKPSEVTSFGGEVQNAAVCGGSTLKGCIAQDPGCPGVRGRSLTYARPCAPDAYLPGLLPDLAHSGDVKEVNSRAEGNNVRYEVFASL